MQLHANALTAAFMTFALATATLPALPTAADAAGAKRVGAASFYGKRFNGRRTANGERFDMGDMTAAHRTLPFGTKVKVTNRKNGRSVVVRINDRGPFHGGRVIDLSRGAASRIGMIQDGVARVELEILG